MTDGAYVDGIFTALVHMYNGSILLIQFSRSTADVDRVF